MVSKKSSKLLIGLIVCGIALSVYLAFANRIMLSFSELPEVQEGNISQFSTGREVHKALDRGEWLGGLFEKYYFQGWAFCETDTGNEGKYAVLIFKNSNSDHCYYVETPGSFRPDVYGVFKDRFNIRGNMHGIECQFSTVTIPSGEYDFFVYVKENDQDYGIVDMNMHFVKRGAEFVSANN